MPSSFAQVLVGTFPWPAVVHQRGPMRRPPERSEDAATNWGGQEEVQTASWNRLPAARVVAAAVVVVAAVASANSVAAAAAVVAAAVTAAALGRCGAEALAAVVAVAAAVAPAPSHGLRFEVVRQQQALPVASCSPSAGQREQHAPSAAAAEEMFPARAVAAVEEQSVRFRHEQLRSPSSPMDVAAPVPVPVLLAAREKFLPNGLPSLLLLRRAPPPLLPVQPRDEALATD